MADSAIVQINGTTGGIVLPRLTQTQRDAIVGPIAGLAIYNSTIGKIDVYNGSTWDVSDLLYWVEGVGGIQTTTWLTPSGATANQNAALIPKGSGAIIAAIPDGTATGGNARGQYSIDLQISRSAASQVASGNYSVIAGGQNNTSGGNYSASLSGQNNISAGLYSSVIGGLSNCTTGNYSFVGGGNLNKAFGLCSFIGGGICNTTSGNYSSSIVGGACNVSCAEYSIVGGGFRNQATRQRSSILGGFSNVASCACSFIVGSNITTNRNCATFVNNLSIMNVPTSSAGLPTGAVWSNAGVLTIV
jgi:hypothetical protein